MAIQVSSLLTVLGRSSMAWIYNRAYMSVGGVTGFEPKARLRCNCLREQGMRPSPITGPIAAANEILTLHFLALVHSTHHGEGI